MAYVAYKQNEDGTYNFMDDQGQTTPPMAGPAAEQQAAKLDSQGATEQPGAVPKTDVASGKEPPPPPYNPVPISPRIRGERAELSPEMLEAGAPGPDLRTAEFTQAPNGSVVDAGGSPSLTAEQQELWKLIDNGMSARDAKQYLKEKKTREENWKEIKTWVSGIGDKISSSIDARKNEERIKAGLPPKPVATAPLAAQAKDQEFNETVAPEDRVQLSKPQQPGLNLAPPAPASAPRMAEMKVGEAQAFTTVDPQNIANIKRADQNQYEAVEQLRDTQAQAGQNVGGVLSEVPQGLTSLEQERQAQEQSIADRVQQDHEELDRLRAESRQEMDSGRFWKKKSNGEKFAGALAIGLGAYVQAMGGGSNAAMQIINKAIDDDIMEQKENRQAARERFQDKRVSMGDKRAVFQDERQNFLGKKAAYLEQAQSRVSAFLQDAKTDEQKARANELLAQIQRQSEMTMAEFSKVSHQVQTKVVQLGGSGAGGPRMEDLNRGLVVQDLTGKKFLARTDTAAKKIQEVRPLTQIAIEASKEMRKIANKPGFEKLDPTDPSVQEFNFARERFVNSINTMMGQGVVRDDDIQRYRKEILGGAYGLATAKVADNFARQAATQFDQHFKANVDTETEVEERPEMDKHGVIKKSVHYNQQQLLSGQGPRKTVNFTPAVK